MGTSKDECGANEFNEGGEMTRDEVIRLAQEAGLCDKDGRDDDSIIIVQYIERFANLVAEHERERIAKMLIDEGWLMAAKLAEVKQ